jgi:KDO2-lipid IV(A) lauroyltransferase
MKNTVEYILFILISYTGRILGLKLSRKFSLILAYLFYYIIPIRKKTTIENLANAYPEYTNEQVKQLAFNCYKSFAISIIEVLLLPHFSAEEMKKLVKCNNCSLINDKYNQGKGVILLSAHFGNWEYIAASFGLQTGISLSVIVKPQRNPYVTEWLNKARTKWSNKVVPLGISIRQVFKELKDKNVVAMAADQRGPADGIRVNFFNRPVSVYPGPAMLALKTGAPILYGIPIRQPDYSYKATMVEIPVDDITGTNEEKIVEISQRHTAYLEKVIREHPEQWLWMHKRWKY